MRFDLANSSHAQSRRQQHRESLKAIEDPQTFLDVLKASISHQLRSELPTELVQKIDGLTEPLQDIHSDFSTLKQAKMDFIERHGMSVAAILEEVRDKT